MNFKLKIKADGTWSKTAKYLDAAQKIKLKLTSMFDSYGKEGVIALSAATPVDTGNTAASWGYEVKTTDSSINLIWTNSNIVDGVPVAILIQYGHGTKNGGYVQGKDFINPTLVPIFEKMANQIWKEVEAL